MKIRKSTLFNIMYIIYITNCALSESQYSKFPAVDTVLFIIRILVLVYFAFYLIRGKKKKVQVCILSLSICFLVLNILAFNGAIGLLLVILAVFCTQHQDLKTIITNTVYPMICVYLFIYLSYRLGIIEGVVVERWLEIYMWQGSYVRNSMGFLNANQAPIGFMYILALYILLRQQNLKLREVIIFAALNIVIYINCNSRTPFIMSFLLLFLCYIETIKIKYLGKGTMEKIVVQAFVGIAPFCCIVSFLFSYLCDGSHKIINFINILSNNRFSSAYLTLKEYGLNLFGFGRIVGTRQDAILSNINVDNGYVIMGLQYGLILLGVVIFMLFLSTLEIRKKTNIFIFMALAFIAIENIFDANLSSYKMIPFYTIFLHKGDRLLEMGTIYRNLRIKRKKIIKILWRIKKFDRPIYFLGKSNIDYFKVALAHNNNQGKFKRKG